MVIISSASASYKSQASRTVARRIACRRDQHGVLSLNFATTQKGESGTSSPPHNNPSRAYSYLSYQRNPYQRNDFHVKNSLGVNRNWGSTKIFLRQFSSGKRDFYDVLGVSKGSDKGTVKKAYFKLAKQHHPDTNKVRTNTAVLVV